MAAAKRMSGAKALAVVILVLAASSNEFVLARLLSSDGLLESETVVAIRLNQAMLGIVALGVLLGSRALLRALVVGGAILNLAALASNVSRQSGVTFSEGKLPAIREALPTRGNVGYISDETLLGGYIGTERFNLTQYALAPVVVDIGPTHDLVVANFSSLEPQDLPDDFFVVRDFGNGVLLLQRNRAR